MTTDHEAKAREISEPVTNVFEALDLPHEAKGLEVWCAIADELGEEYSSDQVRACVSAIASALREAEEREREACAKLFKQRLEGLSTHARNHIHEDQTRFDIRHKARLAVAEELLSWLATAIRGRNSNDASPDL